MTQSHLDLEKGFANFMNFVDYSNVLKYNEKLNEMKISAPKQIETPQPCY